MPQGKTGRTATTSNIGKARKDTETTSIDESKNATVTSKTAAKSSSKSKDKAKALVQSNRGTDGRPKSADPVPPPSSTRHLRPGRGPKVSAQSKRRAGRDPERSASRHRTKRQSGKADDPRKTSATGRGTQNKVSSKSITELIPAPADSAETLHVEKPQVGPFQEDPCTSGSRQLLTGEALEELARGLESDPTNRNRSAKKITVEYSGEESEDGSSQEIVNDSQERFNHKWGYVPPLDEETTRIIEAIIKNPARAETMQFLSGLHNRNVLSDPSSHLDPRKEEIQSIPLEGYLQETQEQETSHEELWKSDKAKCTPDSSEALYQRTLMINLITRHCLIYQLDSSKQQIFDFSVEEPWGCLPMPSRLLWAIPKNQKSEAKFLTQPKPDLAVCFKREAVISDRMWKTLPEPTKGLACFENSSSSASRIFHFLAVEAKKAMLDLDSPQALHQCLNNASQALHNMFEFFRDAGPEHEQVFYNKVRFFSVVANRKGIIVRIHRAIRKPDDAGPWELVMPDRPDYRLEFEFREFQRISDADEFSRKKVLEVVKKILKYATDDLLKMINAAASKLVQNLEKDLGLYFARREADFYSYGQPNPKSFKSSRRTSTSVVPSTIGDGVQRQFQSAKLDSNSALLGQSIASGQTTPNQSHQSVISSRLATTAKKRGVDELEDMRALDSPVRRRRRLSCSNNGLSLPSPATAGIAVGSQ
ncbi:MAG: hypothetical protein ALECFALPRED_010219 [Alectoria fallacina]|uniref:DUF7924 domain-containing protein n=1 Tax=Alectoria fallacina TaxID=1903189 RepID=A0A8H3J9I6_9LECA|nr:MAG: hypothetical protein ALECFALPRED_010219 [Alectoria fallacina]